MKTCDDLTADIGPITESEYTRSETQCSYCFESRPSLAMPGVAWFAKKVESGFALYVVCDPCYKRGVRYGCRNGIRGSYNVGAGREEAVGVASAVTGAEREETPTDTAEAGA